MTNTNMRNINIRMVFPPYVDTDWRFEIKSPDKATLLNLIKQGATLERHLNPEHTLYLAISDFPDWLVDKERFSISHSIGDCHIFIQVEKEIS